MGLVRPAWAVIGGAKGEIVRDGIQRMRVLRLSYGGFRRMVEPHALGLTAGGHPALLAWQIEGGSRTAPPHGWRTFILSETRELRLTVRGFTCRPSYQRDRSGLREIELDVSPADPAAAQMRASGPG